jgi:hypothetical protein
MGGMCRRCPFRQVLRNTDELLAPKYLLIYTAKEILVPTVKEDDDVPSTEKAVFGCKTKQQKIIFCLSSHTRPWTL